MTNPEHAFFESLYRRYNRPEFIHPDPLELVRAYDDPRDREIVALICSSLALGRVAGILSACRAVLDALPAPYRTVTSTDEQTVRRRMRGFVYRFFREEDICRFVRGIRSVLQTYGSLQECYRSGISPPEGHEPPSRLQTLVTRLRSGTGKLPEILLPVPSRGSACKRLHLFLRWMVRSDEVDPGGWHGVDASGLYVPVDTHMLQVARHLGITSRKQADGKTAAEITDYFRSIRPEDPVRYDFVLTRSGISNRSAIRRDVYQTEFRVRPAS